MNKNDRLRVKVGDMLPELAWPTISRIQIACMAGATEDYNPMHIDDDFARSEGFGGIFAHPLFTLALFEQLLDYYNPNINVVELSANFQKLVRPGDLLIGKGRIIQIYSENNENRVKAELWAENQKQETVAKGAATFLISPHRLVSEATKAALQHAYKDAKKKKDVSVIPTNSKNRVKNGP